MRAAALALSFLAMIADAQPPPVPEEVLARAQDKILDRNDRLPDYMCVQAVNRQFFKRRKDEYPPPSCDQMSGEKKRHAYTLNLRATDRLRLDVKVSGGVEIGSWAGAGHFEEGNVMAFIHGPFGTGPFGTFLIDIFNIDNARFRFEGDEVAGGVKLLRYRFVVPEDSSHYLVRAGNHWRVTGYDGNLWIDPNSSELRRMAVTTSELPEETGTCQASTTVDYASMRIGTGDFLLPQRSVLHFLMRDTTESEVAVNYSACQQFHGEANLVADPGAIVEQPVAARTPASIPAGLALQLKLAEPIDSDKAAAGDVVTAKVGRDVRDPKSAQIVIPGGSTIHGRILRMEHWLDSPPRFIIAIQLEAVEINGVWSPLYATRTYSNETVSMHEDSTGLLSRGRPVFLEQRGTPPRTSSFYHFSKSSRYLMPRGFESDWITVAAPNDPPLR